MIKNIIFDLDGTLIDSARDIIDSLEEAFLNHRIPLKTSLSLSLIGPPIKDMIDNACPGLASETVAKVIASFRTIYDHSGYPKTYLYPGVTDLLNALRQQEMMVFIVTNKPNVPTQRILKKLNIFNYFQEIVCINDYPFITKTEMIAYLLNKYSIKSEMTMIIGDTLQDVLAGIANHVTTVAYLGGYGNKKDLMASQAHLKIEHLTSIKSVVINL